MPWYGKVQSGEVWAKRELLRRHLQALTGYRWYIFCHHDAWNMQFICMQDYDKLGRLLNPLPGYRRSTPVFEPEYWTRERLEEWTALIYQLWKKETVETEWGRESVWAKEQRQWGGKHEMGIS